MLKNYMETLVDVWMPRLLAEETEKYADVCRCPACIARIRVETLNRMPPYYVAGEIGELCDEGLLDEIAYKADLLDAIDSAIGVIRSTAHAKPKRLEESVLQMVLNLHKHKGIM